MGLRTRVMNRLGWVRKRNVSPRLAHPVLAMRRTLEGAPVEVVFDVGAHDGSSAIGYRRIFKGATIHSFEPAPAPFAALVERFKEDGQVVPVNLALADASGTATFQVNQLPLTSSLLKKHQQSDIWLDAQWTDNETTVEVSVDTLDNYCEREGIEKIDLLKVDAQGADLKVLQGAERMLGEGRIRSAFVETGVVSTYEGQGEFHEICGLMHDHGYTLFDMLAPAYAPSGQLMWCDLLFARGSGVQ